MHGPIKVKSPKNTSKWQMGFNSAFKDLMTFLQNFLNNFSVLINVNVKVCFEISACVGSK
jgi:hypothetical protein